MKISIREKILLTILLCAGIVYLVVTYMILPDLEKKAELEVNQLEMEIELTRIRAIPARETTVDADIATAYGQLDTLGQSYFHTTQQEEWILLVNDLFEAEGIEADNINFSTPQLVTVGETDFLNNRIDIGFRGDYNTLLQVLDTIWAFPKHIQVGQLSMSVAEMIYDEATLSLMEAGNDLPYEVIVVDTDETESLSEAADDNGATTENTQTIRVYAEPEVVLSGTIGLEYRQVLMAESLVDDLYTWYIDETYAKQNPFLPYAPLNATIRYIFTGEGANLFNFDRFTTFDDFAGHWLEDELQAFLELGYIFSNNYNLFGPDQPITRGDFVVLLDSVYGWSDMQQTQVDVTQYRDYSQIGDLDTPYARAVQRGLQRGFIEGYPNNTLGLEQFISYQEVQLVMQRIQSNDTFTWEQVAADIRSKKNIQTVRWQDLNETLTKAEAVYMLTYFR